MTKLVPLGNKLEHCPKCYINFYNYVASRYKGKFYSGELSNMLSREPCHVKLISKEILYDFNRDIRKYKRQWYLEFETIEDYMIFALRWS